MSAVGPRRPDRPRPRPAWLADAERLDLAVYAAIAATPSPALDRAMGRLTRAADHSKLSLAAAAALAVFGGPDGRRAATSGLATVGVTTTVVNVGLKLVARRRRPDPVTAAVPITRQVRCRSPARFPPAQRRSVRICDRGRRGAARRRDPAPCPGKRRCLLRVHTGVHFPAT